MKLEHFEFMGLLFTGHFLILWFMFLVQGYCYFNTNIWEESVPSQLTCSVQLVNFTIFTGSLLILKLQE